MNSREPNSNWEDPDHRHETDLEDIRHAEVEISDRIQQARADGDRQVREAKSKADEIRTNAELEARAQAKERYEQLVSEYQRAADERIAAAQDAAERLRKKYAGDIETEAGTIVRQVLGVEGLEHAD
jgi:V/A-type H+-transporting ATPase subunit G/H